MKLKTQKKPLFIYDWYGTVEAPWWTVFLIEQYQEKCIAKTEAQFADILHADTFIFCGLDKKQITDGKTLPHVEQHVTGYPMMKYLKERLKEDFSHLFTSTQIKQTPSNINSGR